MIPQPGLTSAIACRAACPCCVSIGTIHLSGDLDAPVLRIRPRR